MAQVGQGALRVLRAADQAGRPGAALYSMRLTATRPDSMTPTDSTSARWPNRHTAFRPGASTPASARRWPGWRPRRPCVTSPVSSGPSTSPRTSCTITRRSCREACSSCTSASIRDEHTRGRSRDRRPARLTPVTLRRQVRDFPGRAEIRGRVRAALRLVAVGLLRGVQPHPRRPRAGSV